MWLYDVPIAIALPLFVALFVGISLLVVLALRKWVPREGDSAPEWDRVLGYAMASYGVLYGVTLALIAAASYENYRGVEQIVLEETSAISVLYRDASGFPEPTSTELQSLLIEYTDNVINVDWVRQAGGVIPSHTSTQVTEIEQVLFSFQPSNSPRRTCTATPSPRSTSSSATAGRASVPRRRRSLPSSGSCCTSVRSSTPCSSASSRSADFASTSSWRAWSRPSSAS